MAGWLTSSHQCLRLHSMHNFPTSINSPLPWFCWVILISHCAYHGNPTAVHLDDLIIISGKLVVEQGIFHQERLCLCDFINLGIAKLYLFFSDYNLQLRKWAHLEWNSHFNEEGYIWSFFLTCLPYSFILFQGIRELSSFRNFPSEWRGRSVPWLLLLTLEVSKVASWWSGDQKFSGIVGK